MFTGAAAPERSLAQRREALQRANEVRCWRAALKREIKAAGKPRHDRPGGVAETLRRLRAEQDDPRIRTMKVIDLLLATPGVGKVKAGKLMQICRISPSKTLGGMSARQRAELGAMLSGRPRRAEW